MKITELSTTVVTAALPCAYSSELNHFDSKQFVFLLDTQFRLQSTSVTHLLTIHPGTRNIPYYFCLYNHRNNISICQKIKDIYERAVLKGCL